MKKFIISTLVFLFLTSFFIPSQAFSGYKTCGGHIFAVSELRLNQAINYSNSGQFIRLHLMIDHNMVRIFPAGIPVTIYSRGGYRTIISPNCKCVKKYTNDIIRVRVSGTGGVIWWTTKEAFAYGNRIYRVR